MRDELKSVDVVPVSIHAPREGCDFKAITEHIKQTSFNSRTPGGVRPNPN